MTQIKQFKDFGIEPSVKKFTGDKIKISKVLNKQIIVLDKSVDDSKYGDSKKYLRLQIEIDGEKRVVFTGSTTLIDEIQRVPATGFPFTTTIIEEDERYEFR